MTSLMKTDERYKKWISDVSKRFRQSQIKAAVKVNSEMLRFYWSMGKDIAFLSENAGYGSNFYKTISSDLRDIFPDIKSFSPTNLKYMRYFYEMYPNVGEIRQQLVDESGSKGISQQTVDQLEVIFHIPWGHHIQILGKCRGNAEKALFYVKKTIENNWSRAVLLNFLDTDLYERQGKAVTNFALTLPKDQSDLAQAMTKDPYNFDFLTLREQYNEKELKDALINKVENFLMELGTGFAYMGREVMVKIGDTEKFLDLLAVNHQIKMDEDKPTVGLLVCKDMDKVEAQYALESSSQPLGVSSYVLSKLIPEEFKGSLPTIEEIEAELTEYEDTNSD